MDDGCVVCVLWCEAGCLVLSVQEVHGLLWRFSEGFGYLEEKEMVETPWTLVCVSFVFCFVM